MDDFGASLYTNGIFLSNDPAVAAGVHNSLFRGKSLGTFTDAISSEITSGRFTDLWVGDYFTINSRVYRIAHFDPFYNCGDTALTTHHIAVVPDASMGAAKMNDTAITTGGYVGSLMRTENLATPTNTIKTDFGSSHVMTYRDLLTTAVSSGEASGWSWNDCCVELMSETMVYGCSVWAKSGFNVGCLNEQLALFRLSPRAIHTRYAYWLRGVASASQFAIIGSVGNSGRVNASDANNIRPFALIA